MWIDAINRVVQELKVQSATAPDLRQPPMDSLTQFRTHLRDSGTSSVSTPVLIAQASSSSLLSLAAAAMSSHGSLEAVDPRASAIVSSLSPPSIHAEIRLERSAQPPPGSILHGVLGKESFTSRYIKDRYFVLYPNVLVYYKVGLARPRESLPSGAIFLYQTRLSTTRDDPIGKCSIRIYHPQRRVHFLHVKGDRELRVWSTAIRKATKGALSKAELVSMRKNRVAMIETLGPLLIQGMAGLSPHRASEESPSAGPGTLELLRGRSLISVMRHLVVPAEGGVLLVFERPQVSFSLG